MLHTTWIPVACGSYRSYADFMLIIQCQCNNLFQCCFLFFPLNCIVTLTWDLAARSEICSIKIYLVWLLNFSCLYTCLWEIVFVIKTPHRSIHFLLPFIIPMIFLIKKKKSRELLINMHNLIPLYPSYTLHLQKPCDYFIYYVWNTYHSSDF